MSAYYEYYFLFSVAVFSFSFTLSLSIVVNHIMCVEWVCVCMCSSSSGSDSGACLWWLMVVDDSDDSLAVVCVSTKIWKLFRKTTKNTKSATIKNTTKITTIWQLNKKKKKSNSKESWKKKLSEQNVFIAGIHPVLALKFNADKYDISEHSWWYLSSKWHDNAT